MTLQEQIDRAIQPGSTGATVAGVKQVLERHTAGLTLPQRFRQPSPSHYARRLLFANPALGYTAVVMTWGPGQGTPVHDHSGIWCVECVIDGEMTVTRYELLGESEGKFRFHQQEAIRATVGQAGCLIPPFEHHVLANGRPETSITLHIYGGEISRCNVYYPGPDGLYERQTRALRYDD